jgi:hypothetical protein
MRAFDYYSCLGGSGIPARSTFLRSRHGRAKRPNLYLLARARTDDLSRWQVRKQLFFGAACDQSGPIHELIENRPA